MATQTTPLPAAAQGSISTPIRRIWDALRPSFPDVLFVALLFWLFAGGPHGWLVLLADGDAGWHIRTGEYILDHGKVPKEDLFSFSKPGEPWFAWEWGADVIFALLFRAGGFKAFVLFAGALICLAVCLLLLRMLDEGVNLFVALAVTALAAGGASVHYLARPHIFTILLMAAVMWLLSRDRAKPTRWVWTLIPITVVWTNLHGGFLALIASTAIMAAGAALEGAIEAKSLAGAWARCRRYALLTAACSAATVANPYGVELHLHVGRYLTSDWIRNTIGEFQSPSFRAENVLQFEILLFAGLLTAGSLLAQKKIADALLILLWAHMSLASARHIPLYIVVAAPWVAWEANRWWNRWTERASKRSVAGILRQVAADVSAGQRRLGLLPVLVVAALPLVDHSSRWPADFPAVRFPVKAADSHPELLRNARMLTTDQWADYLIFRFYPHHKVFVDGRSDFYGREIGQQYLDLWRAHHNWRELIEKWRFNTILIPVDWPLASVLKAASDWQALYDDQQAILFVRRGQGGGGNPNEIP